MQHLEDLAVLAAATGRDLVLPNVSGSRYGISREFAFSLYRDVEGFRRALNLSRVHQWPDYLAYARRRSAAGHRARFESYEIRKGVVSQAPHASQEYLDGPPREPVPAIDLPRYDYAARARTLRRFLAGRPADALLMKLDIAERLFAPAGDWHAQSALRSPMSLVPYNPAAVATAQSVLSRLGPTIAVHWRCVGPPANVLTVQARGYLRRPNARRPFVSAPG